MISISIFTKPNTPQIVANAKLQIYQVSDNELDAALFDAYVADCNYFLFSNERPMLHIYGVQLGIDPLFQLVSYPFFYNGPMPSKEEISLIYKNHFNKSLEENYAPILEDLGLNENRSK